MVGIRIGIALWTEHGAWSKHDFGLDMMSIVKYPDDLQLFRNVGKRENRKLPA